MNIAKIKEALKTQWLGHNLHFQPQVDSTNQWAKKNHPRGTVLLADEQTAGRGRLDRKWESNPGENILISFVDSAPHENMHQITLVTAVALLDALLELFPKVPFQLKWPNDLLINKKKVAGILCELVDKQIIIGIGINCNQTKFSGEISQTATSLKNECRLNIEREMIIAKLLNHYESRRKQFNNDGFQPFQTIWTKYSAIIGKPVTIVDGSVNKNGVVSGMNNDGFLVVDINGKPETIMTGDICF